MDERNHRIASRLAAKFGTFECEACAAEIIKALGPASGSRVVRIRPADDCKVVGLAESKSMISNNRSHVGVRVGDTVFDNLHPGGVPAEEWPGRFITQTGVPLVEEERSVDHFFGPKFRRQRFRDWVFEA